MAKLQTKRGVNITTQFSRFTPSGAVRFVYYQRGTSILTFRDNTTEESLDFDLAPGEWMPFFLPHSTLEIKATATDNVDLLFCDRQIIIGKGAAVQGFLPVDATANAIGSLGNPALDGMLLDNLDGTFTLKPKRTKDGIALLVEDPYDTWVGFVAQVNAGLPWVIDVRNKGMLRLNILASGDAAMTFTDVFGNLVTFYKDDGTKIAGSLAPGASGVYLIPLVALGYLALQSASAGATPWQLQAGFSSRLLIPNP